LLGAAMSLTAWSVLESDGHERYRYDTSGPEWTCRGELPRVCLDVETTRPLEAVAAEMHRQAAALVDAGIDVPDTFDQAVPAAVPRAGHGIVEFLVLDDLRQTANPTMVAESLATPTLCPQFSS